MSPSFGFDVVDAVRRRVQQQTLGHRGRRGDPLCGMRVCWSRRRSPQHHLVGTGCRPGSRPEDDQHVARAGLTPRTAVALPTKTRAEAERRLLAWFIRESEHEVPELMRLGRTLAAERPDPGLLRHRRSLQTDTPKQSTPRPRKSNESAMGSATSPTTDCESCSLPAAPGPTVEPPTMPNSEEPATSSRLDLEPQNVSRTQTQTAAAAAPLRRQRRNLRHPPRPCVRSPAEAAPGMGVPAAHTGAPHASGVLLGPLRAKEFLQVARGSRCS